MDKLIAFIDEVTDEVQKAFGSLSNAQLNWKPNPQTWSIAQNLHHLIVINQSYYQIIEAIRKGTYSVSFMGKMGFMVNFLGKTILQSVQPDRKKKINTFPIWEPSTSEIHTDILSEFVAHQNELKQMIRNSQDLIDKGTVIASPANKHIVYKLATAFEIIVTHEQRHLAQAKEILLMVQKQ